MLVVSPIDFYISRVIVEPNNDKIQKVDEQFNQLIGKIKEDDRFKHLEFQKSRFRHNYKEDGEIKSTQIRWYSRASMEEIKELIDRWNACDNQNPLNIYRIHYIFNTIS